MHREPYRASSLRGCLLVGAISVATLSSPAQETSASKKAESDSIELSEFVVVGYRASLEKSLVLKRESGSIIDVITAEDVGKFPDTNVAESLSHITGISVDHQFGEGEKVSILGTDPALNRVLVNGQTIASGDWGGNPTDTSGRTFNYTLLSPEIIGTAEVHKATEARLDEGSIGGAVIINTRRPLDLPTNTLRASAGYAYNDRSEKGNPRGSVLFSWKSDDKKVGALVAVTHDKADLWRGGVEYFGFANANLPGSPLVPFGLNATWFKQKRERNGLQAAFQWKPTDTLEFNVTGIYIKGIYDNFNQSRYTIPAFWGTLDSYTVKNGYVTSGHVTAGNATVNGVTLVGPAAVPYNADGQYDTNLRKSTVDTKSLNVHGDYRDSDWHIGFDVGYTDAKGGKDPEYLFSLMFNNSYSFSYDGQQSSMTFDDKTVATNPKSFTTRRPNDQAGGVEYTTTDDNEGYGQIDFDRPVKWGAVNKILFGAKYTDHINKQKSTGNYIHVTTIQDLTAFSPSIAPTHLWDGLNTSGDMTHLVVPNQDMVVAYLNSLPSDPYQEKKGQEWNVAEKNGAAFTQVNFAGDAWRGNMGVRAVHTTDTSKYWNYDDVTQTYSKVKKDVTYTRLLPSFNFNLDLAKDVLLRAGIARVLARPRYSDLAGQFDLDNNRLTGGGGNPDLKPYEATNINVALEWYFAKSGIISAEYFLRDVSNYVLSVTQDKVLFNTATGTNATYSISSPFNAGAAQVHGMAFTIQKDIAMGFGISTNYTYAEADTPNGYNMPFLSKHTVNVIPYFERGPFSARVSYSWRSEFFTQIGRLSTPVFSDQYKQLDASASYQITKNIQLSVNATNLLDSTYFSYYRDKYAPFGIYKTGRVFTVSATYKL